MSEQEQKIEGQEASKAPAKKAATKKPAPKAAPKAEAPAAQEIDAEKLKKDAEDAAFKRICDVMGLDHKAMLEKEKAVEAEQDMEVNLGRHIIRVNGIRYTGIVKGKRSFIEQLAAMAGARAMRLLNEMIGNKGEVALIAEGISTKIVGQVEEQK